MNKVRKLIVVFMAGAIWLLATAIALAATEESAIADSMVSIFKKEKTEQDGARIICRVSWPVLNLQGNYLDSERQPLREALKDEFSRYELTAVNNLERLTIETKKFLGRVPNYSGYSSYEIDIEVKRADDAMISYLRKDYQFIAGMAHPVQMYYSGNYSVADGKKLEIYNICTNAERLSAALKAEIAIKAANRAIRLNNDFGDYIDSFIWGDGQFAWTNSSEGITFYFSAGEIFPYAAGPVIITLTNEKYPELFNY